MYKFVRRYYERESLRKRQEQDQEEAGAGGVAAVADKNKAEKLV